MGSFFAITILVFSVLFLRAGCTDRSMAYYAESYANAAYHGDWATFETFLVDRELEHQGLTKEACQRMFLKLLTPRFSRFEISVKTTSSRKQDSQGIAICRVRTPKGHVILNEVLVDRSDKGAQSYFRTLITGLWHFEFVDEFGRQPEGAEHFFYGVQRDADALAAFGMKGFVDRDTWQLTTWEELKPRAEKYLSYLRSRSSRDR